MNKKKPNKDLKSLRKTDKVRYGIYKNQEFVGDALISFIVRDYFASQGVERTITLSKVYTLVSNKHLSEVFDNLSLKLNPIFHVNSTPIKAKANQIEYMVYQMYKEEGLEKVKDFIIKNIIGFYYAK